MAPSRPRSNSASSPRRWPTRDRSTTPCAPRARPPPSGTTCRPTTAGGQRTCRPWTCRTATSRRRTAPRLPATVVATYNDGSKDSRIVVTWDPVDPDRYARPGTFEVKGTVDGTTYRATATTNVTAPP
ncbi:MULTISPECIES: Ig-like domain-containing protein [unclassified Streptomyces]|uniref:Ig-like domain-containing protein n=1 Tax=unclassified Streptomyces TaxID=2593676 RepID=UPI0033CDDAD3